MNPLRRASANDSTGIQGSETVRKEVRTPTYEVTRR